MRTAILVFFAITISWAEYSVRAEEKASIEWQEKVLEAWNQAVEQQRPLLVYVEMDGCGYCRQLEKETFSNPAIAEKIGSGFIAAKLDGPKEPKLAKRLGVRAYPTLVIISPENKVLDSISGYVDADELGARLEKAEKDLEVALAAKLKTDDEKKK